jgi:GNAT superfamily N-acetyltransferase
MLNAPEPLGAHHVLDGFTSGVPPLDDWLKRRALANQASGASRTFVVCEDEATVVGFHALAASAVSMSQAVGRFRRNMPDPIPVIVLARLAVSADHQGRGIGRGLFQDAARRVVSASDTIGVRGLIVHTISEEAAAFYRRLGFDPSPLEPMTLMITLADLRASMR